MREVGVYSVGCSGYGYLVVSQSHNMKISRNFNKLVKSNEKAHPFE